jgi:hypothetical protein
VVTAYDYDRYPPIVAAVGASPDPAYLFITASTFVSSFEMWCHDHSVGYQAWRLGRFTLVQPAAKITPGMLPPKVLY